MVKADFGSRMIAFFIDVIIYLVIQFLTVSLLLPLWASEDISFREFLSFLGILFLIGLLYFWIFVPTMESSKYQGTIGKIIMKIKVTDIDGRRLSIGRAVLRAICKQISGLPLMAGYFVALFNANGQALHDMIVSTIVTIKVDERDSYYERLNQ
ncbi:MAG TPA: RDD family protein [Cytophagales bacterium]|nr:RDD family protein [Cytophagales bacterium]